MPIFSPANVDEVCNIVSQAISSHTQLEIRGGGSKSDIGLPARDANLLDTKRLAGIIDYDPSELILTAFAGTPLAQIQSLIADREQMLAFEPFDHGPMFGRPAGAATIGGVIAAAVSGSNRLSAGAVRDHLLGFEAVSGRGERFIGGAKVVKNVTGYDLPKIMAGSWGRCAVLTSVTLKVMPRAKVRNTLIIAGLSAASAYAAMAQAMRSQAEVSAAAHLPADAAPSTTALRIQGFGPSVIARSAMLQGLLSRFGNVSRLDDEDGDSLWAAVREVTPLGIAAPLWRVNVAPSGGLSVITALENIGGRWLCDWAGGLIWLATDADAHKVRAAANAAGGHAALVRGSHQMRLTTPALHPESAGVAALSRRVRSSFDPSGVFETGRFLDLVRAD